MSGIEEVLARVRADLEESRLACEGTLPKREVGRLIASHPIVERRTIHHIRDMSGNILETHLGPTEIPYLPVINPIGDTSATLPVPLPPVPQPEGRVFIDGLGLPSYWGPMQLSRIYPAPEVPLEGLVNEFGRVVNPVETAAMTRAQVVQHLYARGLISQATLIQEEIPSLVSESFDIRTVRPAGLPAGQLTQVEGSMPRPILAGIDVGIEPDRTVISFLRAGAVGGMSQAAPSVQQALEEAILMAAWSEAYPNAPVLPPVSQLTEYMRDRLLQGLNLLEDGELDLSDFLEEVPFQIRASMMQNMPAALQAVRRLLTLRDEPVAEEPSPREADRTGTPYGLRDYLTKRPAHLAAWEKLNGPLAAFPDRFVRILEDD